MQLTGIHHLTAISAAIKENHRFYTKTVGMRRLKSLHVNDSLTALGSNRDRHAVPGEGEIGARGCGAFLSEPRFDRLPALFEGPGANGHAPEKVDVDAMRRLRANGLRARKRRRR